MPEPTATFIPNATWDAIVKAAHAFDPTLTPDRADYTGIDPKTGKAWFRVFGYRTVSVGNGPGLFTEEQEVDGYFYVQLPNHFALDGEVEAWSEAI